MECGLAAQIASASSTGTVGDHLDQPDPAGLIGIDQRPGIKDALGLPRSDQVGQQLHIVERVDQSQLGRGNSEAGIARRDTQVTGKRKPASPTDTVPFDEGDGGQRQGAQAHTAHAIDGRLVRSTPGRVVLVRQQFPDIRPGTERPAFGSADDHQAQVRIAGSPFEQFRHGLPHRHVEGVAFVGPVDQQVRDRAPSISRRTLAISALKPDSPP